MRIRKRLAPSSSSPHFVHLSDPKLHRSSSEVQQHHQQTNLKLHPNSRNQQGETDSLPSDLPSGQLTMIHSEKNTRICSGATTDHELKMNQKELPEGDTAVKEERCSTKDTRNGSIFGAVMADTGAVPPSSTSLQVESWVEGDKTMPLKKRRGGNFQTIMSQENILEKDSKPKMKSKANKKDLQQKIVEESTTCSKTLAKMNNKRGSVIMEGSRCSRVNGRGWRCFQQTLVGYSLCEHHLGKGRLRNITTSVGSRTMSNAEISPETKTIIEPERLSISISLEQSKQDEEILLDDSHDVHHDNGKEPLLVRKKRTKLGMVKARSLSSLLNQTSNAVCNGRQLQ